MRCVDFMLVIFLPPYVKSVTIYETFKINNNPSNVSEKNFEQNKSSRVNEHIKP